jgi:hypothetical protein
VIHDVVDILNGNALAELRLEFVADQFQRLAEAGRRWAIAAHADLDWLGHFLSLVAASSILTRRDLAKQHRYGRVPVKFTEYCADEQARQRFQNFTGWNFTG